MAYIGFENNSNISLSITRNVMKWGSGGEYVHCEILLLPYGLVASSWNPKGIQFRAYDKNRDQSHWVYYDLGEIDYHLYTFFKQKVGTKYSLSALIYNMMWNLNIKQSKSFCSQVCYEALQNINHFSLPIYNASSLSPQDLLVIVDQANFKQIRL